MILRPGGITKEEMMAVVGKVSVDPAIEAQYSEALTPKSPGMKYTHYAPEAEVLVIQGDEQPMIEVIQSMCERFVKGGKRVGIMTCDEHKTFYKDAVVLSLGSHKALEKVAQQLFSTLRCFDTHGVDIILAEAFSEDQLGAAVMNRLKKAAGHQVIEV